MASETATHHSSRPEWWYPNCYTNSRGIPLRVRYPVDIMGIRMGVVQAEWRKGVSINKKMTVIMSIENKVDNLLGAWLTVCQGDQNKKIIFLNAKHEVDATIGWGKIWWLSVFLAFGVYTPTLVWYQLDWEPVARDLGTNIQCAEASVVPLTALLINVR